MENVEVGGDWARQIFILFLIFILLVPTALLIINLVYRMRTGEEHGRLPFFLVLLGAPLLFLLFLYFFGTAWLF